MLHIKCCHFNVDLQQTQGNLLRRLRVTSRDIKMSSHEEQAAEPQLCVVWRQARQVSSVLPEAFMPRGYAPQKWDGYCHVKTLMHATAAHATQSESISVRLNTAQQKRRTGKVYSIGHHNESFYQWKLLRTLNRSLLQHSKAALQDAAGAK